MIDSMYSRTRQAINRHDELSARFCALVDADQDDEAEKLLVRLDASERVVIDAWADDASERVDQRSGDAIRGLAAITGRGWARLRELISEGATR